jgi:hypothetical protein
MCHHILGVNLDKLKEHAGQIQEAADEEEGIEHRISRHQAEKLLEAWKKMKIESDEQTTTGGHNQESLLLQERKLKDRLFVEHGEDVDDAFSAFHHYGLNVNITEEDRRNYSTTRQ